MIPVHRRLFQGFWGQVSSQALTRSFCKERLRFREGVITIQNVLNLSKKILNVLNGLKIQNVWCISKNNLKIYFIEKMTIFFIIFGGMYNVNPPIQKDRKRFWNKKKRKMRYNQYNWFHKKGTWSVHSFNGDYLSVPEGTCSCGYLF